MADRTLGSRGDRMILTNLSEAILTEDTILNDDGYPVDSEQEESFILMQEFADTLDDEQEGE